MRGYGYGSYRGRNRLRTFLLILIAALLLILALAVVGYFLLEPYIVYTSDGIRLELPLNNRPPQSQVQPPPAESSEPPEVSSPVVVITPEATPDPTPESTPEPAAVEFRAVLLPRTALTDGTAAAQVEAAGATAAVFDMKAPDGSLGYISSLERAKRAEASASAPGINEAIQALNAGDLYTVARVSCFRDDKLPYYLNADALRSSAGNWRDSAGTRWLSPAVADARQYIAGVCAELAALGFDEILLDYPAFPTAENGKITSIRTGERYPTDSLDQPVEAFYQEVSAALAPYPDTVLSIVTTEAVLNGDPADASGQTLAQLAAYAEKVWTVPDVQSASDYAVILERSGVEDAASRVVVLAGALPLPGTGGNWAVLTEG